jgi:hypothetical protein
MWCEGCLVPPGNRSSDRELTRPIGAIPSQRSSHARYRDAHNRDAKQPASPTSAEACCNRSSWTHCLQRCDTHPMAAHYRLTHREQRNDATPCHTIAAASGAASGSGQRRIGCGKYRPRVCLLLHEQSQPVRSAGAHTAQPPLRPVLLEQPDPVHSVETRLTPSDGSREARGAGPSQPRPSYLDLSAPEPSAGEL